MGGLFKKPKPAPVVVKQPDPIPIPQEDGDAERRAAQRKRAEIAAAGSSRESTGLTNSRLGDAGRATTRQTSTSGTPRVPTVIG